MSVPGERAISYEALTPTAFLLRAGMVFADRVAVVDEDRRYTYAELLDRALRLAGAMRALGVEAGGRVAVLAPNTHALLEAHYGVPLAGAVLVALNPRLTAADLARIVEHSGASILLYDFEYEEVARAISNTAGDKLTLVRAGGEDAYESMLSSAPPYRAAVDDERALVSITYTTGTT